MTFSLSLSLSFLPYVYTLTPPHSYTHKLTAVTSQHRPPSHFFSLPCYRFTVTGSPTSLITVLTTRRRLLLSSTLVTSSALSTLESVTTVSRSCPFSDLFCHNSNDYVQCIYIHIDTESCYVIGCLNEGQSDECINGCPQWREQGPGVDICCFPL